MRRRGWLLLAAAAVVLPVATVAVLVARLDPNAYKQRLVDAVEGATGRTLFIAGDLTITRSLWPTVTATDVRLANLPGGTRDDMARAERIAAKLDLLALLHHRIEVTDLTLVGPNILFEQAHGQPNWVFDSDADLRGTKAPPSPWSLRIRQVHIQNGMVTVNLPPQRQVIGIRALDLTHPTDGAPIDFASVLVYGDNKPFDLVVSAKPTDGLRGPWATRTHFAAFDSQSDGEGTVSLSGQYDMRFQGRYGRLEELNQLYPPMRLPAVHGMELAVHLNSGAVLGTLPVLGQTRLHFASADLQSFVPGLTLGDTRFDLPRRGGVATISSSGMLRTQRFGLKGTLGMPADLDDKATLPVDLVAQDGPTGSLAVKGTVAVQQLRYGGMDAVATLKAPALAAFRPVLSPVLPALTDVAFHGRVALPADNASVRLTDAALQTAQGDMDGSATVTLGPVLGVDARLRSRFLDADAMLKAFGVQFGVPANHGARLFSDVPIAWSVLRGPTVALSADVARMTVGGEDWHQIGVQVGLKAGQLRVDRLAARSPAGPLSGSFGVDGARDGAAPMELALSLPGVPFGWVTEMAGLPGAAQGTMRIDARLHGDAHSPRSFASSMDGTFSAAMGPGSMSDAALLQLTGASLEALGAKVPASGTAEIGCLGVNSTVRGGVADLRTIAIASTYLTLEGSGRVDLGTETLDLHLLPFARVTGSMVQVPVTVRGPIRAPKGDVNATGLDKVGFLLDGIFGGDTSRNVCAATGLVRPAP